MRKYIAPAESQACRLGVCVGRSTQTVDARVSTGLLRLEFEQFREGYSIAPVLDNVFIERLWRSLKYELIYPGDFASGAELLPALEHYFHFYNHQRHHQALGYRTPADLYPRRFIRKRSLP
jgi:transposase InsO family protein